MKIGHIIYEKDPREQARGGPVATGKGGFDSESKREREREAVTTPIACFWVRGTRGGN